jgi:uncharacterized protein with HEPN domain
VSRSDDERIADILDAATKLAGIVARGRKYFLTDPVAQLACERLIEIIGEAASKISTEVRNLHRGVEWKDIVGMRIRLAHHYHRVDPANVWSDASQDVPALFKALNAQSSSNG